MIWLRASVREAVQRVGATTTRPLLVGDVADRWTRLAQEREPLYAEVATMVVDTDHRTPAQVAHIGDPVHVDPEKPGRPVVFGVERPVLALAE